MELGQCKHDRQRKQLQLVQKVAQIYNHIAPYMTNLTRLLRVINKNDTLQTEWENWVATV